MVDDEAVVCRAAVAIIGAEAHGARARGFREVECFLRKEYYRLPRFILKGELKRLHRNAREADTLGVGTTYTS